MRSDTIIRFCPVNAILKGATSKFGNARVSTFRIGTAVGAVLLLAIAAALPAFAAASSRTFRFALPGGAAMLYGNASNRRRHRFIRHLIDKAPSTATTLR
ncbi:hypothetical protein [Burkholderia sp. NLJ2]|uniref:hypothetical protein n=1 Tax=Burkholderia sp. NLJ2 TaxID=3090699 RepID=UPI003C6C6515